MQDFASLATFFRKLVSDGSAFIKMQDFASLATFFRKLVSFGSAFIKMKDSFGSAKLEAWTPLSNLVHG